MTTDQTTDTAARLRAVIFKLSRRLRRTAAGHGLSLTRVSVLSTIVRDGSIGITALARREDLNPTMLSRALGELADQGLVRKVPDPYDRRAALIEPTDDGRALYEQIQHERVDLLNVQLADLTAEEHELVERALPVLEAMTEDLKHRC